jgi:hypothetical protein
MRVSRILLFLIFAAFLTGCAASTQLLPKYENVSTEIAEPAPPPAAEETPEAEKPKPPAPKPTTTASTTSPKGAKSSTTPIVGSPQWKKERVENERKEQHIKEVIEGICSGC